LYKIFAAAVAAVAAFSAFSAFAVLQRRQIYKSRFCGSPAMRRKKENIMLTHTHTHRKILKKTKRKTEYKTGETTMLMASECKNERKGHALKAKQHIK